MLRASILNQSRGIKSLRTLVARHDTEKMNMEKIKEESSPSTDLVMEGSREEYDASDSTTTDEELGLGDEDTGSERQHLLVKAPRKLFPGKGNRNKKIDTIFVGELFCLSAAL